jgi:hypothetical protein
MYLALERKHNNGGKIHNLSNIASGIMLQLKFVRSNDDDEAIPTAAAKDV